MTPDKLTRLSETAFAESLRYVYIVNGFVLLLALLILATSVVIYLKHPYDETEDNVEAYFLVAALALAGVSLLVSSIPNLLNPNQAAVHRLFGGG